MRARRGFILLLLLAVLCSTGVSLRCYNCLDPVSSCKTNSTCSPNLDACLVAVSGPAVLDLKDQRLHALQHSINGLDVGVGQFKALDLCLSELESKSINSVGDFRIVMPSSF
ncbi:CD59 glycoprotein isoform X2 [Rattus norvegicus]|uniref:CD59b molecule n=1 Tax=Rattus norvegicus TaxID=10116 RepID=A0A8I5ZW00_RAT|nr:CD59 glycoprotein isoform X2 [Rattus norvegicus]